MTKIDNSLKLPCGVTLKNRLAKSAMSENMAYGHKPGKKFQNLYSVWARGGIGLSITGNVMIDRSSLGEAQNIVIDDQFNAFEELKNWAKAGTENGAQLWIQINHPGKQSPKFLSPTPVAPSAISFPPPMNKLFNKPRELTQEEILDIIKKFSHAAKVAKDCGFSGVQIHGAHGYLVNQFLSPLHNQRNDQWGGVLENRMRFLIEIYKGIRNSVGSIFPIGVKLNSADFQRGGFTEEESMEVLRALDKLDIDLIEISGGTYESTAMMGNSKQKTSKSLSTEKREAYFLDYAAKARNLLKTPLMVTGGFRSSKVMEEALLSNALDIIGMARPLTIDPELPNKILSGSDIKSSITTLKTGVKFIDKNFPLEIIYYAHQIQRMGKGKHPVPNKNIWTTLMIMMASMGLQSLKRTRAK